MSTRIRPSSGALPFLSNANTSSDASSLYELMPAHLHELLWQGLEVLQRSEHERVDASRCLMWLSTHRLPYTERRGNMPVSSISFPTIKLDQRFTASEVIRLLMLMMRRYIAAMILYEESANGSSYVMVDRVL